MPTAIARITVEETFSWQRPVLDKDLTAPPGGETGGERYLVAAAGATGPWAGHEGEFAWFYVATWYFDTPEPGWIVWVADEAKYYFFTASWAELTTGAASTGYQETFNATTDWTADGEEYYRTITHGLGTEAIQVAVWNTVTKKAEQVSATVIDTNTVRIAVLADPDNRFFGHAVITGVI